MTFGIDEVTNKLMAALAEVEAWRETGLDTDFPQKRSARD